MNQYAAQWYAKESPGFSYLCECGISITGNSEKGLHTLVKNHREYGVFHYEYLGIPAPINKGKSKPILIKEKNKMPVPGGQITTTEIWNPKPEETEKKEEQKEEEQK